MQDFGHNILEPVPGREPVLGRPSDYSAKHCSESLLKKDFIPFLSSIPLPRACFFHFSDTYSLGSNDSIKFLESLLSLIPFQRAGPALVLECYGTCVIDFGISMILELK
jgi:hypothetical protein